MEHVADPRFRDIVDRVSEFQFGGEMRECGLRAEKCDLQRTFQPQGSGHDFAVDRPQRGIGHGTFIDGFEFFQKGFFPFRDVEGLAPFAFPFSHLFDHFIPLVQQVDDLPVDCIDPHSQVLKIHHLSILPKSFEFKIYSISSPNSSIGLDFFGLSC